MAKIKPNQVRQLEDQELEDRLKEEQAKLFDLRYQVSTDQVENTKVVKETKKNIARILTVKTERSKEKEAAK